MTTTGVTLLGEPLPIELMNTIQIGPNGVDDLLGDDAAVAAWLGAIGDQLPPEARDGAGPDGATAPGVAGRLRELRDALRRLAAEATGDARPSTGVPERQDAIDTVNALAAARQELAWPPGGDPVQVFRATGVPAVAVIAHQAVELFAGAQRARLRACLAPGCFRYFLKQHPRREWCSPVCGNRVRVARHYRRHRTGGRAEGGRP